MLFQRQKRNSMVYQSHFIPLCLQGGVQKKKKRRRSCSAIIVKRFQESNFCKVFRLQWACCYKIQLIKNAAVHTITYKFQRICFFFQLICYYIPFFASFAWFVNIYRIVANYFIKLSYFLPWWKLFTLHSTASIHFFFFQQWTHFDSQQIWQLIGTLWSLNRNVKKKNDIAV